MGRPIQKKYFGNTNSPAGPGEGVASYGSITAGTGWTSAPTVTVSAPTSPVGVTATVAAHYKALSGGGSIVAAGSGYDWHDVLTINTGTGTKPQFQVSGIKVVNAVVVAGGTGYAVGDTITFSTGNATNVVLTVATISGGGGTGPVATVTITNAGVRNAAKPANPVTADSTNGAGDGLATFTLTWGVQALTAAPTVAGDMTVMSSAASATTVSPAGGTGATVTVTYGLLSVQVLTAGSGYYTAADAAISFSGSTGAAATAVLTSSNQNSILATAYLAAADGGLSAKDADIVKQEASTRYLVTTADGTGQCKLVAAAPGAGEMTLKATDSAGGTYYVTKLTAHRAVIVKGDRTGTQFTTGSTGVSVGWVLDTAVANVSVVIENA